MLIDERKLIADVVDKKYGCELLYRSFSTGEGDGG